MTGKEYGQGIGEGNVVTMDGMAKATGLSPMVARVVFLNYVTQGAIQATNIGTPSQPKMEYRWVARSR